MKKKLLIQSGYQVLSVKYWNWFYQTTEQQKDVYIDGVLSPIYEGRWVPQPPLEKNILSKKQRTNIIL